MSALKLSRLLEPAATDAAAISVLISQMSPDAPMVTPSEVLEIVADRSNTCVVVLRDAEHDGWIVGVGILSIPRRFRKAPDGRIRQAWIEDVVIDEAYRGQKLGEQIVHELLGAAAHLGVQYVDLTTRHTRRSAIVRYLKLGFMQRAAGVYRYEVAAAAWEPA